MNIALKLFPDSNQPLDPIPSKVYVYDEVPVNIAIYIDNIYIFVKISVKFFAPVSRWRLAGH